MCGPLGKWKDAQLTSTLDEFRDEFTDKSVRVALCKRPSELGSYRWLEFIDVTVVGDTYDPQYEVAVVPKGVAVKKLKNYGGK
eukprot:CAMPEP_0197830084 /NCGR_PEP_ID=MMETSP1437-20131217/6675_1 /TAXON_ID=49252 ORGANISM="Eucampia antarctica, Strain CCMP1452" /NCGR_SAMPLE_ID=MMETSP1437 /ASSEMBLY_ACC=CAM_ASM_001096 /LENGTH=82 /DNA_ID=CAMNT_0043432225 /DNA_START=135 /DNA_END=380 /DNA_ORIENTATION=+